MEHDSWKKHCWPGGWWSKSGDSIVCSILTKGVPRRSIVGRNKVVLLSNISPDIYPSWHLLMLEEGL